MQYSPVDALHRGLGARMGEFGGWEMPIAYADGTINEHLACRRSAALFDVSHLGTVRVRGRDALDVLQRTFTNDLKRIGPGRAQYTHLCNEAGGVDDDVIVWWLPAADDGTADVFDVMPNASNTARVREALAVSVGERPVAECAAVDTTAERAVLALQGPHASAVLERVLGAGAAVPRFGVVQHGGLVLAGTGYTGEAGVEIAVPTARAAALWEQLVGAGAVPAGLGARDTLRLEAGLPLHGHELGPEITPYDAGLGWVVRLAKGPFRGAAALQAASLAPRTRLLRGLRLDGRQPARDGATVHLPGSAATCGAVTSGNFSPVLGAAIALAFVDPSLDDGTPVECDVRGRRLAATVTRLPFVTH